MKGLTLRNIDSLMTAEYVKIVRTDYTTLRSVPTDYGRHYRLLVQGIVKIINKFEETVERKNHYIR